MAKRKHITVILTILVAALLASGISGWLFLQSVQRVIGEAQQAGEYAAEAQQSVGQGDFKQALELAVTSSRRETKPRACYGRPPNTCCITVRT